jgi:dihydrofolate reductase
MQPTPSDVHVNTPLTNMSIAYIQQASDFIAAQVFPNIPVQKQSDLYFTYDRGMFNRDEMRERAPATESEGSGYTVDATSNYYARHYSFHHDIPDQVRSNADHPLSPDRDGTTLVTQKALIRREKIWVSKFFNSGIWAFDWAGVAAGPTGNQVLQWNDVNSNPIEDVRKFKRTMKESTGFEPNKLVLGRAVYDTLLDHPDFIDRVKYGQTSGGPAMISRNNMAALFEIDQILVMNAIENTAKEGLTNVHAFIGGKKALLAYAPPSPSILTPSAGYTFSWTGLIGSGVEGNRIRTFRMEQLLSDRIEIDIAFDMKPVCLDCGFFLNTIVA